MEIDILLGKTDQHVVPLEGTTCFIHHQLQDSLNKLQSKAFKEGFKLSVISGFRSYERQLAIWNAKASGQRLLHDALGNQLRYEELSPTELLHAILRWSALPGASRHHWGTDIDVFDANTQKPHEVQLIPAECDGDGPAAGLHQWLSKMMEENECFDFFRPYRTDRGGVSPEPWHLSYQPLSSNYLEQYNFSLFQKNILRSEILLKETILENAEEIYGRYFLNIDLP
jgi:LAS superfamily LD-carboxypeptidase LdcB